MSMREVPLAFLGDERPAFLGHVAARLNDLICDETALIAAELGIVAPVHSFSALLFLFQRGPATRSEIAVVDGQSHQLVTFRLEPLERLGLIERVEDPTDGRRKPYQLTRRGRNEVAQVRQMVRRLARVIDALSEEVGVDLLATLDAARERLMRVPLSARFQLTQPAPTDA